MERLEGLVSVLVSATAPRSAPEAPEIPRVVPFVRAGGAEVEAAEPQPTNPIIEFRQRRLGVLFQDDLEQCIALRRVVRQAIHKCCEMETYVASLLRAGAAVEPGLYTPELRKIVRLRGGRHGYYFRLHIVKS